jgi:hypothetical protein
VRIEECQCATPKGRLCKLEKALLGLPWQAVRQGVEVKLLPLEQELYVRISSSPSSPTAFK